MQELKVFPFPQAPFMRELLEKVLHENKGPDEEKKAGSEDPTNLKRKAKACLVNDEGKAEIQL